MGSLSDDVKKKIDEYEKRNPENRSSERKRAAEWIVQMVRDNDSFSSTWSICRVPEKLRSVKNEAYDPQLVSIGPIHYEDPRLRSMENHKEHYLISLFQRTQPDDMVSLEECWFKIFNLDEKVRTYYSDSIEPDKMRLASILLKDAGFMLKLFLKCLNTNDSSVKQDSIFTTSWMKGALERDLALLENQIPFFVLKEVYEFVFPSGADGVSSLNDLVLRFYKSNLNIDDQTYVRKCSFEGGHLLHLLHNCYLPSSPETGESSHDDQTYDRKCSFIYEHLLHLLHNYYLPSSPETGESSTKSLEYIHNATSLKSAGVSFKKSGPDHLLDFKFKKGVFYIPTLRVHSATDSLLRNFIAFEQCLPDTLHYITSYCMLFDRLLDTAKDVEVLVDQQIIKNDLGDGNEVSGVFNNICKEVVLKDFYFAELCEQVNKYSKKRWHSYKADLRLIYFNNPWSTISFIAAIILLALTGLQTLYSVLSYYRSSSPPPTPTPLPPAASSPSSDNRRTIIIVVFGSFGGVLFLAFLAFGLYYLIKKKSDHVVHVQEAINQGSCVQEAGVLIELATPSSSSSIDEPTVLGQKFEKVRTLTADTA